MGALRSGRIGRWVAGLWLGLLAPGLLADSPNAVVDPAGYRESITPDRLREAGYDPEEYKLQVPLGPVQFERTYVRAGELGLLSTGLTERGTDVIRLNLNPRGTFQFTHDEARSELHGLVLAGSTQRTAALTQAFGGGGTTGTLSLTHADTHASDLAKGFTRSRNDRAALTLGLGRSFGLTASAEDAANMALVGTEMRKYDVALTPTSVGVPLVEYHETTTKVGTATSEVSSFVLRTPTVEVAGMATVAATHSATESTAAGADTVDTLTVTAAPTDKVDVTATHVASGHETTQDTAVTTVAVTAAPTDKVNVTATHVASGNETTPDTAVTTVGSQIRVRPGTTVTAGYTNSETEGVGTTTQRSVAVAMAPTDGKGLGVEAAFTDTQVTNAEVDPTVRVRLTYALPGRWEFSGQYLTDASRADPELVAALKAPFLGGALGLNYSECVYDATVYAVRMARSYGTELTRPLLWGLTGKFGYQRTDNLADPTAGERFRMGVGGAQTPLGAVDVQYEIGRLRTAAGRLPDGEAIAVSLTRQFGSAEVAVTGKRAVPSALTGSVTPNDEVHLDLKASW